MFRERKRRRYVRVDKNRKDRWKCYEPKLSLLRILENVLFDLRPRAEPFLRSFEEVELEVEFDFARALFPFEPTLKLVLCINRTTNVSQAIK